MTKLGRGASLIIYSRETDEAQEKNGLAQEYNEGTRAKIQGSHASTFSLWSSPQLMGPLPYTRRYPLKIFLLFVWCFMAGVPVCPFYLGLQRRSQEEI
jgi:hypothetical protein